MACLQFLNSAFAKKSRPKLLNLDEFIFSICSFVGSAFHSIFKKSLPKPRLLDFLLCFLIEVL